MTDRNITQLLNSARIVVKKEEEIKKADVTVAKNYLNNEEIDELNRIVVMYLDYAENQAKRQIPMSMEHWIEKLDAFLQFNEYKVLDNAGSISHTIAQPLAEEEYEKFRVTQDAKFVSDFDRAVEKLKEKKTDRYERI